MKPVKSTSKKWRKDRGRGCSFGEGEENTDRQERNGTGSLQRTAVSGDCRLVEKNLFGV